MAYKTGLLSGLFYKVLGNKDMEDFKDACLYSLFVIIGMVVVKSLRQYTGKTWIGQWRRKICVFMHNV